MSTYDTDLAVEVSELEVEWHQAYERTMAARAEYQALAAQADATAAILDRAHEELERAEESKARVMLRIERLESEVLGRM